MSAELAGKAYVEMSVKGREEFSKAFSDMQASVQTFAARLSAVKMAPSGSAMSKFFKSAKSEFNDLVNIAKKYGTIVGVAIGATTVAVLGQAIKKASDLQETMNKFNVVFGDNAKEMENWGTTFAKQMGRSKQQVMEFMSNAQGLVVPMGVDPAQAQEMSKTLAQLSFDLASFHNSTDIEAFDALKSAITGESEPMKKFGVIVNETAVKAEMLKRGLDPTTANEAQKAMARYNIILEGTKQAQGDVERSGDSFANRLKALQATWDDLSAQIGTAFLPLAEALLGWFTELIASLGKTDDATMQTSGVLAGFGSSADIVVNAIGFAVKAFSALDAAFNLVMGTGRELLRMMLQLAKVVIANPLSRKMFGKESIDGLVQIIDEVDKATAKLQDQNFDRMTNAWENLMDPNSGQKAVDSVNDFVDQQKRKYDQKREELKKAREDAAKEQEAAKAGASKDGGRVILKPTGAPGSDWAEKFNKEQEQQQKKLDQSKPNVALAGLKPIEDLKANQPAEAGAAKPDKAKEAQQAKDELAGKTVQVASPQTLEATSLAAFEKFRENAQNEQKAILEKQLAVQNRMAQALANPDLMIAELD